MGKKKKSKTINRFFAILMIAVVGFAGYKYLNMRDFDLSSLGKCPIPKGYSVLGIDVSHHNGKIDWEAVKVQGVRFAYVKSTEGVSHTNQNYESNYQKAKKNNITAGMYHFFIFKKDGAQQAKFFIENSEFQCGDLPPMVDVEYSTNNIRSTDKKVIKQTLTQLRRFDSVVYRTWRVRPVIYTNKECYEDLIRGNFPQNHLWICDLSQEPCREKYADWHIWQYSHTGKIKGIKSKTDMNVFHSTEEDFEAWVAKNTRK